VKLLLDTQILLWAAGLPERLTYEARELISADANMLFFCAASIWEVAIKSGLGRDDLPGRSGKAQARSSQERLPGNRRYRRACARVLDLPPLHRDPFDRLLVAQATIEGLTLHRGRHSGTLSRFRAEDM